MQLDSAKLKTTAWYTVTELANLLGTSRNTMYKMLRLINPSTSAPTGGRKYYSGADIISYLNYDTGDSKEGRA